ncbi:Small heat shock protein HSP [Parasponia andersonii]|uniref:Small heat shock protein HSP n=1 Tax=Parasponia andersonii TaxID=3476 RepID=A0A2P5C657_PARAD|nr:Small heat shock protein HSP [Parasponia andersonii]
MRVLELNPRWIERPTECKISYSRAPRQQWLIFWMDSLLARFRCWMRLSISFTGRLALIDWRETPSGHVFKTDVPGLRKQELKVAVEEGRVLKISGERKRAHEERTDASGKFERRIRLPENAKVDQLTAALENGVLTVTVPKVVPRQTGVRSIEISDSIENLPKLVEDIVQTSINTGPRGALRMAQGIQAVLGVGGEWLADMSKSIHPSHDVTIRIETTDTSTLGLGVA